MANILVHITSGPEHPTRAALDFLVAKATPSMTFMDVTLRANAPACNT